MPHNLTIFLVSLLTVLFGIRCAFGARRIPGIPYHKFLWWLPTGSLVELAIHFYLTGETFDWFFYQGTRHESSIVQLFLPSFSFTKPVLIITGLREIEDIATRRTYEIDRSTLVRGFFRLFADHATIGMKTYTTKDIRSGHQTFKNQRRLWNCMLTPRTLEHVGGPALHRAVERMVNLWELKAQTASCCAFEVHQDIRHAALEGMFEMLTGETLGLFECIQDSIRKSTPKRVSVDAKMDTAVFKGAVRYPRFYEALNTIFTCLDWVTTGFSPQFYTWLFEYSWILSGANRIKDQILDDVIDRAKSRVRWMPKSTTSTAHCVLEEVLLRDTETESKSGLAVANKVLRDEMMELLITGHETTASAAGWALKYLADNQNAQYELWRCLSTAFPGCSQGALPSARDLMRADLPYLDAVIAETLRLSSTGPVSFRETTQDCQILGQSIKSGTQLILVTGSPAYNILGDRQRVDTDDEHLQTNKTQTPAQRLPGIGFSFNSTSSVIFEPGRWITSEGKFDKHAHQSLPFSAGPRGCFGRKIALLDLRLMIALVIVKFKLPRLAPGLSVYNSRDSLTRKPTCCYVRPEKRAAIGLNSEQAGTQAELGEKL